jgi:hypothetical protein
MKRKSIQSLLLVVLSAGLISLDGCTTAPQNPYLYTGAGVGAALGAAIGAGTNGRDPGKAAAIGGLLGGALGAVGGGSIRTIPTAYPAPAGLLSIWAATAGLRLSSA